MQYDLRARQANYTRVHKREKDAVARR